MYKNRKTDLAAGREVCAE
ncbi:hypothetical protein ELI_1451 [Eubacterium callanderi]|uniref:Uncharacterized protein n=1 Tax=Eubacterium callanderi TaxID=53442 RepID=E3GLC3_9FIRM|nr:hypothetical protein ELI_1451 [Eubacterium callanderi]